MNTRSTAKWDIAGLLRVRERASELNTRLAADRMHQVWVDLAAAVVHRGGEKGVPEPSDGAQAGGGSNKLFSLPSISRHLFDSVSASSLYATYMAVSASPLLFKTLNCGNILLLPPQPSPGEAHTTPAQGGRTLQITPQDLALTQFVSRVTVQLQLQQGGALLDILPGGVGVGGGEVATQSQDAEWDADAAENKYVSLLENVALGTVSVSDLPLQLRTLLVAFASAQSRAAAASAVAAAASVSSSDSTAKSDTGHTATCCNTL